MARGFDSKSVEAQQEEFLRGKSTSGRVTAADAERFARRKTLELARARAESDLNGAASAAYRRMLETAIRAIDDELAEIDGRRA